MRWHLNHFLAFLIAFSLPLGVSARPTSSAQLQLSFQLKDAVITLHEPVILVFKVHNESTQETVLDLGVAKTEFVRFSLKRPRGTTVESEPPYTEGLHASGSVLIPAEGDYQQEIILNQWVQFDSAGRYLLTAILNKPVDHSGTGKVPDPENIRFEIKERSPKRLKKICADLGEAVTLAPNADAAQEPALLLSYVKDPIAIPYLSKLLDARKLVENAGILGLERIGDEGSAKVLIASLDSDYRETSDLARQALQRILSKTSDPVVRQTIRNAGVK